MLKEKEGDLREGEGCFVAIMLMVVVGFLWYTASLAQDYFEKLEARVKVIEQQQMEKK